MRLEARRKPSRRCAWCVVVKREKRKLSTGGLCLTNDLTDHTGNNRAQTRPDSCTTKSYAISMAIGNIWDLSKSKWSLWIVHLSSTERAGYLCTYPNSTENDDGSSEWATSCLRLDTGRQRSSTS